VFLICVKANQVKIHKSTPLLGVKSLLNFSDLKTVLKTMFEITAVSDVTDSISKDTDC